MGLATIVTRAVYNRGLIQNWDAVRRPQGIGEAIILPGDLILCLSQPALAAETFTNTDCLSCHLGPATTRTVGGKGHPTDISDKHFR